jgi:putative transposase
VWITTFDTVEALRVALLEFRDTYNETWLIARHGYKTPSQVRQEQLAVKMSKKLLTDTHR